MATALEQLRQDVYAEGAYYREEPNPLYALAEDEFRARLDPAHDGSGINEYLLADWRAAQRRSTSPASPATEPHHGASRDTW
ncbi:hypothetical protein AB0873_00715 [Micromonospora sp. NPDC047707]|uniref:hypothetical protein n=1 Tax=Micromonospora sp. NPDC047707 TaxID=3154498 RepID=UPI003454007C